MDPEVNVTKNQKMIAFAQSDHVQIVIQLLQECGGVPKLLGDTDFETIVNAATLDAQQNMINKFINQIDFIKKGGLVTTETNG